MVDCGRRIGSDQNAARTDSTKDTPTPEFSADSGSGRAGGGSPEFLRISEKRKTFFYLSIYRHDSLIGHTLFCVFSNPQKHFSSHIEILQRQTFRTFFADFQKRRDIFLERFLVLFLQDEDIFPVDARGTFFFSESTEEGFSFCGFDVRIATEEVELRFGGFDEGGLDPFDELEALGLAEFDPVGREVDTLFVSYEVFCDPDADTTGS